MPGHPFPTPSTQKVLPHTTIALNEMNKDELLKFHQMIADIKDELQTINPELEFPQYTALKITPAHTQVSRSVHKHAVFVLGQEIAHAFTDLNPDSSRRMASRMKECADKSFRELELRY